MKRNERIVPLESLLPTASVDPERVKGYAAMDSSTQPPIQELEGFVVDGNHRWFASLTRGDRSISIKDCNLPDDCKNRWLREFGKR